MSQRVPSWDLDDTSLSLPVSPGARRAAAGTGTAVPLLPMSDYGIAELTWANGHVTSHGMINKPVPKYAPLAAVGNCAGGGDRETLEAVVSEAATRSHPVHPLPAVPAWLGARMASAPADALVPCGREETEVAASQRRKRPRVVGGDGKVCASQASAAPGRDQSTLLTLEACGAGADDVCGFTTTTNNSTSLSAPLDQEDKGSSETENTSIGGGAHDSLCRSQEDGVCEEGEAGMAMRTSSVSTKRSRAAAVHNESERKRRDRINQKMKTLQKLVPNSSKTDKASMLDGVIDHLKQLQAQVQLMNRMSSMMMPIAMPQLHMSMMANMAQMAQMGLAMMNMGPMAQPAYACLTPPVPPLMHPPPFVPLSWDGSSSGDRGQQPPGMAAAVPEAFSAFLACQAAQNAQQPTSMEAYNRMVALYQTLNQQNQPTSSKH